MTNILLDLLIIFTKEMKIVLHPFSSSMNELAFSRDYIEFCQRLTLFSVRIDHKKFYIVTRNDLIFVHHRILKRKMKFD